MTSQPDALTSVAAPVEALLETLLRDERAHWTEVNPSLCEPLDDLSEMVLSGGKRIRPAYCYWGWVLGGGDHLLDATPTTSPQPVLAAGCALELLHAFALVHDDVMDASPTRRNAPSVWAKFVQRHHERNWAGEDRRFGESAAVLVGDMAMVLADRTLGPVTAGARQVWDTLRTELNMGQYLDVAGTARGGVSKNGITAQDARMIIEHKTARYTVVRPLQLGAALANDADGRRPMGQRRADGRRPMGQRRADGLRPMGRSHESFANARSGTSAATGNDNDLADKLVKHGRPVGTMFQLRDDVLGAYGDPTATGKPVGDDLRENKPTLLMALATAAATPTQRQVLDTCGPDMDDNQLADAQQTIADTGALKAIEDEIEQLLDEALQALADLPQVEPAQSALKDLAHYVATRQL